MYFLKLIIIFIQNFKRWITLHLLFVLQLIFYINYRYRNLYIFLHDLQILILLYLQIQNLKLHLPNEYIFFLELYLVMYLIYNHYLKMIYQINILHLMILCQHQLFQVLHLILMFHFVNILYEHYYMKDSGYLHIFLIKK